jgi:hypothetical protein
MSELYNKVKKNVLASKDADAINQLDVMEGKTSNTPFLNKLKKVSRIGKAVAIPIALGTAAYEALKDKKKEDKSETPSNVEGKKEGGLVRFKKQYQMHNGKF